MTLPLAGKRVVVTRAQGQAGGLSEKLARVGAKVIEFPTIEIRPAADYGPLDKAIAQIGHYDWVIFTSANGVRFFLERMARAGANVGAVNAKVCAIGPATRRAAESAGFRVTLVPAEYVAESMVAAFAGYELQGARMLLPRAAVARDVVPSELAKRGAKVDVVEAYRTVIPEDAPARARRIFGGGLKPDWITFTSSSTVKNFVAIAGRAALEGVKIASIGPITSATARELRLIVHVEADPHTITGLVRGVSISRPPPDFQPAT